MITDDGLPCYQPQTYDAKIFQLARTSPPSVELYAKQMFLSDIKKAIKLLEDIRSSTNQTEEGR